MRTDEDVSLMPYAASKTFIVHRHFHYELICKTATDKTNNESDRNRAFR